MPVFSMASQIPEPIAIIGSGCRFPGGASSPSRLWDLLSNPRDISAQIPESRFNLSGFYHQDSRHHGTTNTQKAYFLEEDSRLFDNGFFGIRREEAESMDPQQRILLEVVYESLEAAGYPISQLKGSSTGVYVGQLNGDYYDVVLRNVESAPQYTATGTARSIMSNRVSYFFDWNGPSVTIDTACSSSLVALHLAVQALRVGESKIAVAAGVNLLLGPEQFIFESNLGMLSPNGRCAMWDANADGYARGDGVAAVLLKPLSAALRDGDHIECIIRQTGVNQDGRTTGITMPSATSQADLIRSTYAACGLNVLSPQDRCQYFEAHGTGTPAGDPIEARAVQTAFFPDDSTATGKLLVGSIKTVVGHTEGTAGLAGLLKASLSMQHGIIPPNLHFSRLSPAVEPFFQHLEIPTTPQKWPDLPPGVPRRASINSFGFGGTNCHVIVESWEKENVNGEACGPLLLSANSPQSLMETAARLLSVLKDGLGQHHGDLGHLLWTLQNRRSELPFKLAFSGRTQVTLMQQVSAWLQSTKGSKSLDLPRSKSIVVTGQSLPILGVFTGQGAQWATMSTGLLESSHLFRETIQKLEHALGTVPENPPSWSLEVELRAASDKSRLQEASISQPLCTAVQIGLVNLLQSAGITFERVAGHSSGEIAAAYAAGYLTATEAIRIAYYRGLACSRINEKAKKGGMLAADMTVDDAKMFCGRPQFAGRLCVAACNSATSVTLSGDLDAVDEALNMLSNEQGVFARGLRVDTAYHSHHMKQFVPDYRRFLVSCDIKPTAKTSSTIWYSSVYPESPVDVSSLSSQYWIDNMVNPVLFSQALEKATEGMASDRIMAVEVGPHPALKRPTQDTITSMGVQLTHGGTLKRGSDDLEAIQETLGSIWTQFSSSSPQGIQSARPVVDFEGFTKACLGPEKWSKQNYQVCKKLPHYSWDHDKPLWRESRASKSFRTRNTRPHPLLGARLEDSDPKERRWRNILKLDELEWLSGHKFQGQVLLPAQGYVSMALDAGITLVGDKKSIVLVELEDLSIHRAITLEDHDSTATEVFSTLRVDGDIHDTGNQQAQILAEFSCSSALANAQAEVGIDDSRRNFACRVVLTIDRSRSEHGPEKAVLPRRELQLTDLDAVDIDLFYKSLRSTGLQYSGDFLAQEVQRTKGYSCVKLGRPVECEDQMLLHPAILDVASHGLLAALSAQNGMLPKTYLPRSIDLVRVDLARLLEKKSSKDYLSADCFIRKVSSNEISCDVEVFGSEDNYPEIQMEGLCCAPFGSFNAQDDRKIFSETTWMRDIMAGIDSDAVEDDMELYKTTTDIVNRAAYFYLRQLREGVPLESVSQAHPHLIDYWNWAVNHVLARVEASYHPRVSKDWAEDNPRMMTEWSEKYPSLVDLTTIIRLGEALPDILAGRVHSLQLLLQENLLTDYYQRSLGLKQSNRRIAKAAAQIVHRYPHLRFLEIGAGTGSATNAILSSISDKFSSYTFTDISSGFFEQAHERFVEGHPSRNMIFRTLDIGRDPVKEQGFEEGAYDVIVASNVLHATPKLTETLKNCRTLLRPGGYLLLLENTAAGDALHTEFIFGTLSGWWLGADDARPFSPLISEARWHDVLLQSGFSGVDVVARDLEDDPKYYTYSVMVSQAVDERVLFLREPLWSDVGGATLRGSLKEVLILGNGADLAVTKVANHLRRALLTAGAAKTVAVCSEGLESFSDGFPKDTAVICLTELVEPVFAKSEISNEIFLGLQNVLCKATHVLWVTSGAYDGRQPHAQMVLGIARSVMLEFPDRPLQFVDSGWEAGSNSVAFAQWVASAFMRMVFLGGGEGQQKDVLWSKETEFWVGQDGMEMLPRIKLSQERNDRLNSERRAIGIETNQSSPTVPLSLVPALDGSGSFALHQRPELLSGQIPEENLLLTVEYSTLCAFRTQESPEPVYICLGRVKSCGQWFFALSRFNNSVIKVDNSHMAVPTILDDDMACHAAGLLTDVVRQLLIKAILSHSTAGHCVWVHEATEDFVSQIWEEARRQQVDLFCSTANPELEDAYGYTFIHSQSTRRRLQRVTPTNGVSVYVNFGDHNSAISKQILSTIDKSARIFKVPARQENGWVVDLAFSMGSFGDAIAKLKLRRSTEDDESMRLGSRLVPAELLAAGSHTANPTTIVDWTNIHSSSETAVQSLVRPLQGSYLLSSDKTYFLAGLTGSVGLSLCNWMADHGARYFILASRNPSVECTEVEKLAHKGAKLQVLPLDLSNRNSVLNAVARVSDMEPEMPPVGGVVNGAMILRDRAFENLTLEDLNAVLRPKVQGSINLEAAFGSSDNLDFFVFLSSASSVVGVPGLANYNAANLFMTGLAQQRRKRGVPASVIDIGVLSDVGYLTKSSNAFEAVELASKHNTQPLSEADLHVMFAEAIFAGGRNFDKEADLLTGLGLWDLSDPDQSRRPSWFNLPRMSHFLVEGRVASQKGQAGTDADSSVEQVSLMESITSAPSGTALAVLESAMGRKLQHTLQIPLEQKIDPLAPLLSLGLDSLVAIQLRTWISKELGVNLPALKILDSPSVRELGAEILRHMNIGSSPVEPTFAPSTEVSNTGTATPAESTNHDDDNVSEHDIFRVGSTSHGQDRLLFLDNFLQDKSTHNCVIAGKFTGSLDLARLERAIKAVTARHEALRSSFFFDSASGRQAVHGAGRLSVEVSEGSQHDFNTQLTAVKNHQFDVGHGEVMRTIVVRHTMTEAWIIVAYHHLIMDGSSLVQFLYELQLGYSDPQALTLLPSPVQAIDLSERQLQLCADPDKFERDLKYWQGIYQITPSVLPLFPFAKSRHRKQLGGPQDPPFGSHTFEVKLGSKFAKAIKAKCTQARVTKFHFCLAALAAFLSRWLDVSDLVIGVMDSNRPEGDEFQHTIGYFLNSLALRFSLSPNASFDDLLSSTKEAMLSALEHSTLPFDALVTKLYIPRSGDHHPLFQVAINYRLGHGSSKSNWGGGCEVEWTDMVVARNPFDLHLDVTDIGDGGVWIGLGVQKYLYSEFDAEVLGRSFVTLLEGLVYRMDGAVSPALQELRLADKECARRGVMVGTGPDMVINEDITVIHRVFRMAAKYPESIAIKDKTASITYQQLMVRVGVIRTALAQQVVGKGRTVAVYATGLGDILCAMLAIMAAGCVYVPLERRNSLERLALMLEDCEPHILLCKGEEDLATLQDFIGSSVPIVDIDSVKANNHNHDQDELPLNIASDSPACIIFTSGSTGRPKGVIMSHINILNQVLAVKSLHDIKRETVLQQSSLGFDCSLEQIFGGLAHGGTVVMVPDSVRGDPASIAKIMAHEGVTYTVGVPSEYAALIRFGGEGLRKCTTWKLAVSGGEKLTRNHLDAFAFLALTDLRLVNAYGPAEGTVSCTRTFVNYRRKNRDEDPDVGTAMPNYTVVIVNDKLEPVPEGFPGEICIGGAGVAAGGYVTRPDETVARFIIDPPFALEFSMRDTRFYRTGDLGRFLPDGSLQCLGRIEGDAQVQIRGVRVELDEVAAVIVKTAGAENVSQAAVSLREGDLLVAFVVLNKNDKDFDLQDMIARLPLPPYMCPSFAVPIEKLPLTPNGKLDRRALDTLPLPEIGDDGETGVAESLTETESRIREIWLEVLPTAHAPVTGKEADFFRVGGNSLLLIQLQALLKRKFGLENTISLPSLFRASSLGAMASLVQTATTGLKDPARDVVTVVDWDKEISLLMEGFLEEDLPLETAAAEERVPEGYGLEVILTGATGFLGQHLLEHLISSDQVKTVHCVAVRSGTDSSSGRIHRHPKVREYPGDLTSPLLGLSIHLFQTLASRVDVMIHNGADTSFLKTYDSLKPANVLSTRTLARFAVLAGQLQGGKKVPVHFISTASVAAFAQKQHGGNSLSPGSLARFPPCESDAAVKEGYAASKWVGEVMLERLAGKGVTVVIHRPVSLYTAEDGKGEAVKVAPDVVGTLLRFSSKLGAVPHIPGLEVEGNVDMAEVGKVAGDVVAAALAVDQAGKIKVSYVHHVGGDDEEKIEGTAEGLAGYLARRTGRKIEVWTMDRWLEEARVRGLGDVIAGYFEEGWGEGRRTLVLPCLVTK
ncbi:Putative dual specificity polyketide synthase/Non ribosomal peptide synthase [Podospora comata]|uniref:Dual specificity polyketide synthase/Non ribosomal peptide synthase n=1 Tax=Podospora comata TaxID=48703 RepID=A0ABY6RUE8_PODCO|nr:Putative dual specificity polyketide synthase/Non ribosomal peptide synthase [Podospora comata]